MTSATIKWVLEVDAPLEEAWQRLAGWSDGRNGAPITSVTVPPPGELGPTARGGLQLKRLGPNRFPMSVWEPPVGWGWVGGLAGVGIVDDHRFASSARQRHRWHGWSSSMGPGAACLTCLGPRVGSRARPGDPRLQGWVRR
jgi:hypothetical protein